MTFRQAKQQPAHPVAILDEPDAAIDMDIGIIPSRHAWAVRIPTWRNVGVRAMKDCEDLTASSEVPDLRVGARKMALQVEFVAVTLEEKGDVARNEPIRPVADEQTKVMPLNMPDQHLRARFGEGRRQIDHQSSPLLRKSRVTAGA